MTTVRAALGAALVLCAGCEAPRKPVKLVPVSGVVLLNKKPVAGAQVTFLPEVPNSDWKKDFIADATTDVAGKFTLKTIEMEEGQGVGCQPGKYKVTVVTYPNSPTPVPDDCRLPEKTPLRVTVPDAGKPDVVLEMTAAKPRP